jgi:hypothetical protein
LRDEGCWLREGKEDKPTGIAAEGGRRNCAEKSGFVTHCYAKVHEVSRKFAQIRPVNPRCYALLRVRAFFQPIVEHASSVATLRTADALAPRVAGMETERSLMFAYVRLKSLMFAFFEKKYFFPGMWSSVTDTQPVGPGSMEGGPGAKTWSTGRRPEAPGIVLAGWTSVGHVSWRHWKLN